MLADKLGPFRIYAVGKALAFQEEAQPNGHVRRLAKPTLQTIVPQQKDLASRIKDSQNKNVSIHGTSGSGKTLLMAYLLTLFFEFQKIIFCFKPNDYYLRFNNIRLDVSKYLPDPFASPYAFLGAFETAFSPDTLSLQTMLARNELPNLLESVNSWDELREKIAKGKQAKDSNLRNAYGIIENATSIIDKYQPHPIKFPKSNVVLDFTGFGDNNKAKAFYAELILRQLYGDLVTSQNSRPIIIAIDEAHRLFQNGERSNTVLKEIAKEGRQAKANVWLSTQNYSEIPSKTISNFAFQFLFKTNEEDDLRAARSIADHLPYALTTLPDHMFVNMRDAGSLERYETEILYYAWQGENLSIDGKLQLEEVRPIVEKKSLVNSEEFMALALDMLGRKPIYVYEFARELEKRYGLVFEQSKKVAWDTLTGLKKEDESQVDSITFDLRNKEPSEGEGKVKARVLYYFSGIAASQNESQLHRWQLNWTAVEYKRAGYQIIDEAKPDERNLRRPDLVVEKSGRQISVEIETGLKHGKVEDLKARIEQSQKEGRDTIIVVPNNDVRAIYQAIFPKSLVTCFYSFIESLKVEESAKREDAKEMDGSGARAREGGGND